MDNTGKLEVLQLKNSEDPNFAEFWKIYSQSFPSNEKRSVTQQKDILGKPQYQLDIYTINRQVTGLFAFWSAPEFIFVEHFAVASEFRRKNLGSKILHEFISGKEIPVVLEIETPIDELTYRRLRFYESLGFKRNHHLHFQPPYQKGDPPLKLVILTWPDVINDQFYQQFSLFQKEVVMG
jgi:ribosomal protein S18 acetylase RimI-like enzyme